MGRRAPSALAALVLLLCLGVAAHGLQLRAAARARAPQQLASINRSELLKQLNKEVTVEGYFYDGSIPMIVDTMEAVAAESAMSPDAYVAIVGPVPPSFKSGAKVKVSAQVQKPTGEELKQESAVLRVSEGLQSAVLQAGPAVAVSRPAVPQLRVPATRARVGKRYALLIGGGVNVPNNHVRYWNELRRMYHTMLSAGYEPASIRVAYASGTPRAGGMPVNYPATVSGIQAAFSYFVGKVKAEDNLYVFVSGQGSPPGTAGPTAVYWAWGWAPMTPTAFAAQVNRITSYSRIIVHMNQSYSGAFTAALMKPKRTIVTAAAASRSAYTHPSYQYGNFNYWYLSALFGHQLLGGAPVDADANDSGKVSVAEAYNYTLPRPGGAGLPPINVQRPQMEDNGALPSQFGFLPRYGEGALAAASYL